MIIEYRGPGDMESQRNSDANVHQYKRAHLSRFVRPICPGSGTGTKGSGLKPKTFSPGSLTNRDQRPSTWPLGGAQAGGPLVPVGNTNRDQKAGPLVPVGNTNRDQKAGPLVPVGNTNRDQKASVRSWGFCFFLKGRGVRWFCRVNLGVSYCVSQLIERSVLFFSVLGRRQLLQRELDTLASKQMKEPLST